MLLEDTKAKVLEKKAFCDKNKLPYEQFLPPVTGYPFYNASAFTMATLKNEIDPQRLKMNVLEYFNGFSPDVQDIIDKFQLRHWVDALTNKGRLGSVLEKFTDASINLSVKPGRKIQTMIFGQELQDDTYATCKADLMISGNIRKFTYRIGSTDHQYIACGSTISQDGHAGESFDFCVMNPRSARPGRRISRTGAWATRRRSPTRVSSAAGRASSPTSATARCSSSPTV